MPERRRPRVTCAIIFRNDERFLGQALDSVLEQTFIDWELLLVDDGSSDKSARIAHELAERHPDPIEDGWGRSTKFSSDTGGKLIGSRNSLRITRHPGIEENRSSPNL